MKRAKSIVDRDVENSLVAPPHLKLFHSALSLILLDGVALHRVREELYELGPLKTLSLLRADFTIAILTVVNESLHLVTVEFRLWRTRLHLGFDARLVCHAW